jgi:hypothetical protein
MADGAQARQEAQQARRHRRGSWWSTAVVSLLSAFLLGMGIWLLAAPPPALERDEATGVGAVFAVLGLLAAVGALLVWRKANPPRLKGVELTVTPRELARGGSVRATVALTTPPDADAELELALVCTELYDIKERVHNANGTSYDQRQTKEAERHRVATPVHAPGASVDFDVPAAEAFSYHGEYISAVWKVRLQERRPRRADRVLDELLWVRP